MQFALDLKKINEQFIKVNKDKENTPKEIDQKDCSKIKLKIYQRKVYPKIYLSPYEFQFLFSNS